jgi:hypothetical protein
MFLTLTTLSEPDVEAVINPQTEIFSNAKELVILDHNGNLATLFIGLFKNFRNIRKLSIISDDPRMNTVIEECLPEMTQLNEIYLNVKTPNPTERFISILNFAPNIKKLSVVPEFFIEAKEFFVSKEVEIFSV